MHIKLTPYGCFGLLHDPFHLVLHACAYAGDGYVGNIHGVVVVMLAPASRSKRAVDLEQALHYWKTF